MTGKPLKFSSQRILRQSVVRGEKCLAVLDPECYFSHHPNSHFNYPPNHCKEGSFWLGVFPASQCVTGFGFNTSAYPNTPDEFQPTSVPVQPLSPSCPSSSVAPGESENHRHSPSPKERRNAGTVHFRWNSRGGPTSFSVTSLEFRKLWAAVKVKSKGLRMAKHGDVVLFRSLFLVLEFLRLLEWHRLFEKLLCADFCDIWMKSNCGT